MRQFFLIAALVAAPLPSAAQVNPGPPAQSDSKVCSLAMAGYGKEDGPAYTAEITKVLAGMKCKAGDIVFFSPESGWQTNFLPQMLCDYRFQIQRGQGSSSSCVYAGAVRQVLNPGA